MTLAYQRLPAVAQRWRADRCTDRELLMLTLYRCAPGAPRPFAIRAHYAGVGGPSRHSLDALLLESEQRAVDFVDIYFPDLVRTDRDPLDAPDIVCTWL